MFINSADVSLLLNTTGYRVTVILSEAQRNEVSSSINKDVSLRSTWRTYPFAVILNAAQRSEELHSQGKCFASLNMTGYLGAVILIEMQWSVGYNEIVR